MLFDSDDLDTELTELKEELQDTLFREARSIFWTNKLITMIELMGKKEAALFLSGNDDREKMDFQCEMKAYRKILRALSGLAPTARR